MKVEDIKLWHTSIEYADKIYAFTENNSFFQRKWSLRDQIERAVISISANISE